MGKRLRARDCRPTALEGVSIEDLQRILEELCTAGLSGLGQVVDCRTTLTRLAGDWNMFRDLLGFYFEDAPELMRSIHQAIDDEDAAMLQLNAHHLKGLVSNYDAQRAVAAAGRLEQLAAAGDQSAQKDALAELIIAMDEVQNVLHRFCPPKQATPATN